MLRVGLFVDLRKTIVRETIILPRCALSQATAAGSGAAAGGGLTGNQAREWLPPVGLRPEPAGEPGSHRRPVAMAPLGRGPRGRRLADPRGAPGPTTDRLAPRRSNRPRVTQARPVRPVRPRTARARPNHPGPGAAPDDRPPRAQRSNESGPQDRSARRTATGRARVHPLGEWPTAGVERLGESRPFERRSLGGRRETTRVWYSPQSVPLASTHPGNPSDAFEARPSPRTRPGTRDATKNVVFQDICEIQYPGVRPLATVPSLVNHHSGTVTTRGTRTLLLCGGALE